MAAEKTCVVDFLKQNGQDYPFLYAGQKLMWSGSRQFGACCEPLLADDVNALRLDRYSRASFNFTVAGAAAPVVGPAAGTINLFGAGKGEDAAGAGFPAGYNYRESDTNAYAGGAPVNKGHLYYIFGVAVEFEDIEVFGAGPAFNTSIPAWVYANTTGTGAGSYYERMMRAISHNVAVKFLFANTAVNYDMGTLADWPSMSGLIVSESARVGQPIVGAYIPLQSVLAVNSRDESRKLTVQLNIERQVTVENDPNNPTVAAAPTTLSALVKMRLWGLDLCSPDAAAICGVKTGPEELATLLAAIQNNPALAAMLSTAAQK